MATVNISNSVLSIFILDIIDQMTMLGPGWFPLDISELGEPRLLGDLNLSRLAEPGLLGDLNLSRLGLRAVSAVTDNSNDTSPGNVV